MTDTPETANDQAKTSTFDFAKWQEEERARSERLDALHPKNKTAIFAALAAADITTVTAEFDGYGDSGGIEDIHTRAGDRDTDLPTHEITLLSLPWRETEPVANNVSVFGAIEHIIYELLSQTHGGWENNAGAFGSFTFDVAAGTITLEFNMRFEDTEFFEHTF